MIPSFWIFTQITSFRNALVFSFSILITQFSCLFHCKNIMNIHKKPIIVKKWSKFLKEMKYNHCINCYTFLQWNTCLRKFTYLHLFSNIHLYITLYNRPYSQFQIKYNRIKNFSTYAIITEDLKKGNCLYHNIFSNHWK